MTIYVVLNKLKYKYYVLHGLFAMHTFVPKHRTV